MISTFLIAIVLRRDKRIRIVHEAILPRKDEFESHRKLWKFVSGKIEADFNLTYSTNFFGSKIIESYIRPITVYSSS